MIRNSGTYVMILTLLAMSLGHGYVPHVHADSDHHRHGEHTHSHAHDSEPEDQDNDSDAFHIGHADSGGWVKHSLPLLSILNGSVDVPSPNVRTQAGSPALDIRRPVWASLRSPGLRAPPASRA